LAPTIRAARPSDELRLLRLVKAYYDYDSLAYSERPVQSALLLLLRDNRLGRVWVVETGRALREYAVLAYSFDLELGGREDIVTDLFVTARLRNKGYGKQLLSVIGSFCKRAAIYEIEVVVTRQNRAARGFYKALGFRDRRRSVLSLDLNTA
jgi:GNAT superfamily N-acetyltransferase